MKRGYRKDLDNYIRDVNKSIYNLDEEHLGRFEIKYKRAKLFGNLIELFVVDHLYNDYDSDFFIFKTFDHFKYGKIYPVDMFKWVNNTLIYFLHGVKV